MEAIKFLGVICATWLFVTGSEPVHIIKGLLGVANETDIRSAQWIRNFLRRGLNCSLCMGFWIGLISYQNFWYACLISLCAEIFARLYKYFESKFNGL